MNTETRNRIRHLLATIASALVAGVPLQSAHAQQSPEAVQTAVKAFLAQEASGLPGKVEITIGAMDPQNQLPPCAALEPFFPAGTRAWGQINVGVRCDSPVTWTAYIPAQVAVMTEYLVTARPIRPGQIVGPTDVRREFGDLAMQPASTLTDTAQAVGHHARYAVASGNTLRAEMLRLPPSVRQGQTVKILSSGGGFTVTNEGRALNAAAIGEEVRVRLANGQVVSGTAAAGGTVEIRF